MVAPPEPDTHDAEGRSPNAALLLIDFINEMDFDGAEPLRDGALRAGDAVLRLRERADAFGMPVIYVNDNFGEWRTDWSDIVAQRAHEDSPTSELVRKVAPRDRDYHVVKPHLSGFYATSLPVLLPKLGVRRLILTGVAADICVLFTAADAHMRDYDLWIPEDCVAAEHGERIEWALDIMKKSMHAEVRPTSALAADDWIRAGDAHDGGAAREADAEGTADAGSEPDR